MRSAAGKSSRKTAAIGAAAGVSASPRRCRRVRQRDEQKIAVDLRAANTSSHIAHTTGIKRVAFSKIISGDCNANALPSAYNVLQGAEICPDSVLADVPDMRKLSFTKAPKARIARDPKIGPKNRPFRVEFGAVIARLQASKALVFVQSTSSALNGWIGADRELEATFRAFIGRTAAFAARYQRGVRIAELHFRTGSRLPVCPSLNRRSTSSARRELAPVRPAYEAGSL